MEVKAVQNKTCVFHDTCERDDFAMHFQASVRRMNLGHAQQQKLLAENRRKEIAREDQIKRINQERTLEANMASEERIENKRFLRRRRQEETEREMDEGIRKVRFL